MQSQRVNGSPHQAGFRVRRVASGYGASMGCRERGERSTSTEIADENRKGSGVPSDGVNSFLSFAVEKAGIDVSNETSRGGGFNFAAISRIAVLRSE